MFFFPTLFPAHTFLILILQTESYTHMLTDTDHSRVRCSLIDSGITHKVKKSGPGSSGLGSSVKTSVKTCMLPRQSTYVTNDVRKASVSYRLWSITEPILNCPRLHHDAL